MKTERNDELSALVSSAIAAQPSAEAIEAASNPPYPTPPHYAAFEKAARSALQIRFERGGRDPTCTTRLFERAQRFSDVVRLELTCAREFYVPDAICLLLAGGLIPVATVQEAIGALAPKTCARFLNRAIVYRLLADDNVEAAMTACGDPVMGDESWVCWRAIGEYHADRADVKSFLALWSKYGARQDRNWIDDMRRSLVIAVSKTHGWREAVLLTQNKRIGLNGHEYGMLYVALTPVAESGDTAALRRLFATEASLSDLSEIAQIRLLLNAMQINAPRPPQTDCPELDEVLARIIAVDPTVSKRQSRHRDWLLVDCWLFIGEEATLKRVRAAIRAPIYKRELKRLAKDGAIG
jgi:hypothetical protein